MDALWSHFCPAKDRIFYWGLDQASCRMCGTEQPTDEAYISRCTDCGTEYIGTKAQVITAYFKHRTEYHPETIEKETKP
jgi:uncharacterized membrane protein YvbJ